MLKERNNLLIGFMKDSAEGNASEEAASQFLKNSVLYKEFLAERGFEKALLDWIVKHRSSWRERRMRETRPARLPA